MNFFPSLAYLLFFSWTMLVDPLPQKPNVAWKDRVFNKEAAWDASPDAEVVAKHEIANSGDSTVPQDEYNMVVAQDGSGDHTSIQEAINSAKAFPYTRVVIHIKNGTYREKVHIYSWNPMVSLIGEDKEKTIITYDDYFDKIDLGRNSTFHTPTVLVEGNDFYARNLTIQNTAGKVGQAIALSVNADRVLVENVKILGNQDTLYVSGEGFRQYFKNCYITGTTDFIFGEATVLFQGCTLHSKSNSFITAASTPKGEAFGLVFKDCTLSAEEGATKVYLGRPWRIYAKTVFIDCTMENHILPIGWDNWSNPEAEKNALYAEYNCNGPGYRPKARAAWSRHLTPAEAKRYTLKNILGAEKVSPKNQWYEKFD